MSSSSREASSADVSRTGAETQVGRLAGGGQHATSNIAVRYGVGSTALDRSDRVGCNDGRPVQRDRCTGSPGLRPCILSVAEQIMFARLHANNRLFHRPLRRNGLDERHLTAVGNEAVVGEGVGSSAPLSAGLIPTLVPLTVHPLIEPLLPVLE